MIRFANESDDVLTLWNESFGDDESFTEYYFKNHFKFKNTLLYEKDGAIVCMLQMLPYEIKANDKIIKASYIYGACTAKSFRKQGYMAKVLEKSFEIDKKNGKDLSFLIPAEDWLFNFYEKFGYEKKLYNHKFEPEIFVNNSLFLKKLKAENINQMIRLYEKSVKNCVMRDFNYFYEQIEMLNALSKGVYGVFDGEILKAYAFPWVSADKIFVQELVSENENYSNDLLQKLKNNFFCQKIEALSSSFGKKQLVGMIKYHTGEKIKDEIYINLMFN